MTRYIILFTPEKAVKTVSQQTDPWLSGFGEEMEDSSVGHRGNIEGDGCNQYLDHCLVTHYINLAKLKLYT